MAIIALGVGFFAGIKATVPSMYNLARTYTDEQELMDYRLVSTVGFDEDDIKAVKNTDGVTSVMPSYFCDVQTDADSGYRLGERALAEHDSIRLSSNTSEC
jgi:putative ABC transport system permease protein